MSIRGVLIVLLLAPLVVAQGAQWVPATIRSNWQQTSTGFCREESQCLVSNGFSEDFDNNPGSYWDGLENPSNGPKCINDTQFILDNYCDWGEWSSRTRLVATQLLGVALSLSPDNFSLYCDKYENVLNRHSYSNDRGFVRDFFRKACPQGFSRSVVEDCVNSVCVLRYGASVAVGASLNREVDDGTQSFLFALNANSNDCRSAIDSDVKFDRCAAPSVWYNHKTNSLLYAPGLPSLPDPSALAGDFFIRPFSEKLSPWVFSFVHRPAKQSLNYSFFSATPQFTHVYLAKNDVKFVYAFKQLNVTLRQVDYAGWYFSNFELPRDACARMVKRVDDTASCESQPSPTEFYIVAHKLPPVGRFFQPSVVDSWSEVVGRIR
ncbi:hypothetical protein HY489_04125 [Candidatus Woesearchaeota archaeon]|nr:hypothetical protein [Candidatus Woesearchaeota archaeon]